MQKGKVNIFCFTVALLMLSAIAVTNSTKAYAAKDISVFVDGQEILMKVPPKSIEGKTMIPVRAVTEAVGCQVEWFDEDKRVVIYSPAGGEPLIVMHVNDKNVTVNSYNGNTGAITGKVIKVDVPPTNINGSVMVPLRFIAETIGFDVQWDEESRSVFLISAAYVGEMGSIDDSTGGATENPENEWSGVYVGDGLSITISEYNGSTFWFDLTLNRNGKTVLAGTATIYSDDGRNAEYEDASFYLCEDGSGIDFFASEDSEWVYYRGHYEFIED